MGQVIKKFNKDKCKDERGAPAAFYIALDEINHAKSLGMDSDEQPTFAPKNVKFSGKTGLDIGLKGLKTSRSSLGSWEYRTDCFTSWYLN